MHAGLVSLACWLLPTVPIDQRDTPPIFLSFLPVLLFFIFPILPRTARASLPPSLFSSQFRMRLTRVSVLNCLHQAAHLPMTVTLMPPWRATPSPDRDVCPLCGSGEYGEGRRRWRRREVVTSRSPPMLSSHPPCTKALISLLDSTPPHSVLQLSTCCWRLLEGGDRRVLDWQPQHTVRSARQS